jgi:hypothetical protein
MYNVKGNAKDAGLSLAGDREHHENAKKREELKEWMKETQGRRRRAMPG